MVTGKITDPSRKRDGPGDETEKGRRGERTSHSLSPFLPFSLSPFSLYVSVLCIERIRWRAFFERRIVLRRFKLLSAHSDTCLSGCHSKLSSGSTSLDASLSLSVLNATKKIAKLNTHADDHHKPARGKTDRRAFFEDVPKETAVLGRQARDRRRMNVDLQRPR